MRLSLAALAALTVPGQTAAQDAHSALQRAAIAYASIRSLRADFRQTIVNPMLGNPETTRGVLYLVPPDRFAMRFEQPAGDRIVADGEWLWAFTPSTVPDQVIRQPIPRSGTATPNLILQFVDRPMERYDATYEGTDSVAGDPVDLVRLVPRVDGLGFRQATIAISARTGLLRRVALIEDSGQRRTLVFVQIEPGAAVPRHELTFVVPDGVRVVTP
jgi:outer membrane lipoprotein carrier protein